jgi:hypothetical protein
MAFQLDYWYEIDPEEVQASVERRIAKNEHFRALHKERVAQLAAKNKPDTWPTHDEDYDRRNRYEREHYAKVRIVCIRAKGHKSIPYYLMYGDDHLNLTGGFSSIQKAARWFTHDGR